MSAGIRLYGQSGNLQYTTEEISFNIIGTHVFSFAQGEYSSKSVTMTGLIDTDFLLINDNGPLLFGVTLTRSGETVTLQRTSSVAGIPSNHYITAFRPV